MNDTADFLVEIGTEELPPNDLQNLAQNFAQILQSFLQENNIKYAAENVQVFATPRRIAVLMANVATEIPEQSILKHGPMLNAARNPDGTPSKAALGFAASCGVDFAQIQTMDTDKGPRLYFKQAIPKKPTKNLLPEFVEKTLQQLPIKKRMRWGAGEHAFVRPIHWILMLFGKETIKAKIWGIETGNVTFGHRIHCPDPIKIDLPNLYEDKLLQEGHVIASFAKRQAKIKQGIIALANKENAEPVMDQNLLDLVTGLVEYPVALLANFEPNFLRVPKECLISAMQDHQKCFALLDNENHLFAKFILISNLESTDAPTVIRGNELVMHARLADAAFHYDNDQKQTLASRVDKLKTIIYQKQLGSLYDKTMRIEQLASYIAPMLDADLKDTKRAAYLCKADLLTNMVYEFPELQGIMGCYYALHDDEPENVAAAIQEHYKPRGASDDLPQSACGIAIALADRIDSLVGFFGIGNVPTGEKDPFALRRQALAILRILIEKNLNIDLRDLFVQAVQNYGGKIKDPTDELINFCIERLKSWYLADGIESNTFSAVVAVRRFRQPNLNPLDINNRIDAVVDFQKLPEAESLAAANKRVLNILQKNSVDLYDVGQLPDVKHQSLSAPEEIQLFEAVQDKEKEIVSLMSEKNYTAVLQLLASLQKPTDNFFDKVMVMVDDEKVRNNRINLLQRLRNLFIQVADISLL